MRKRRLIILGFDGLDPDMLDRLMDHMPNFRRLTEDGIYTRMQSTFPHDSIPAWATIYTGLSPAEHGIVSTFDYFKKDDIEKLGDYRQSFQGRTFWDAASRAGRTVTVINPFMAYPAWEVNGVFVAGAPTDEISPTTFPEELARQYDMPPMGAIPDFPDKDEIGPFVEKTNRDTQELHGFALKLYEKTRPDLFFVVFLTSDRLQHFLWRYCDENDPTFPGPNPQQSALEEFYLACDRIVGDYLAAKDDETNLFVISDHGHGRRCTKVLNLNEFLRQNGYLHSPVKPTVADPRFGVEKLKTFALNFLSRHDLQDYAWKIARLIPGRRALKKSTYIIDKEKSLCYVSELCGTNPQGGICINPGLCPLDSPQRARLCSEVIDKLLAIEDPATGQRVVRWARRREEMVQGPHAGKFPEIMIELEEAYGVNWSLFAPLVDVNPTHKKLSGGHRPYGVFLAEDASGLTPPKANAELYGLILGTLGIEAKEKSA